MNPRILIVDDEQAIRSSLQGLFEDEDYLVSTAASGEEAIAKLRNTSVDCVLLDIWMPGIDGLETLSRIQQINASTPVIMMSGHATIDTAVRATRQGAFDFLEKPLSSDKLLIQVRNAIDKQRLQRDVSNLKACEAERVAVDFVGNHRAMQLARQRVAQIADAPSAPALLFGAHGTGKTMAARMIHQKSVRNRAPFLEVDTAAICEGEFAMLLLGCEQGALPTATHARQGWLERAQGGTLYFNEIAQLSTDAQTVLLKVMQQRVFQHVGGGVQHRFDVRILAGSSIAEEVLRRDYLCAGICTRFNGDSITMPSLLERIDDIPLLVAMLCAEVAAELGRRDVIDFDPSATRQLMAYSWPGNIRELRNYIERCYILCSQRLLDADSMLPVDLAAGNNKTSQAVCFGSSSFSEAKAGFEQDYLRAHLDQCDWNMSHTAEAIGIERSQLYRKMKALGLQRDGEQP
ncbi:MAG: sigma-54 dependent transcriptional regulator [Mariprofundales bacterium]|nr:sigma-54 dependent transcriptional regulator [Mariprofundales bacterium]